MISGGPYAGGAAGTVTVWNSTPSNEVAAIMHERYGSPLMGGSGGGAGGGDGISAGGGGGGGGGVVVIAAQRIQIAAGCFIQADGGDGGTCAAGANPAGGGGGGGGAVTLLYRELTNAGTIQAIGGAGGIG